jgi:hypothetical protein
VFARLVIQHAGPNDPMYSTGNPISTATTHGQIRSLRSSLTSVF